MKVDPPGLKTSASSVTTLSSKPTSSWQIPIPNDYHCNDAIALGCWVKLQLVYLAGTTVSEITTWSAYILGEPVRIVQ